MTTQNKDGQKKKKSEKKRRWQKKCLQEVNRTPDLLNTLNQYVCA